MTLSVSFEQIKKIGAVVLVATNLFSLGVCVSYIRWRNIANPVFGVMEFDVNDRMPQIRARFLALQAEQAKKLQEQAQAPAATTTSTTLPPKK